LFEAGMCGQHVAGGINKIAGGLQFRPTALDESSVIVVRDETNLHAVRLVMYTEVHFACHGTHFFLAIAADGEEQMRQQAAAQAEQHIGLVLGWISAALKEVTAVAVDDLGVMARGDEVGVELLAV
jgi:hypothetical protein